MKYKLTIIGVDKNLRERQEVHLFETEAEREELIQRLRMSLQPLVFQLEDVKDEETPALADGENH